MKMFFKRDYFIATKKCAIQENFADLTDFLKNISDEDILKHLVGCSSKPGYVSETSCDEFLWCLSNYLETKMKNRLIPPDEFNLLTDEFTDILNRAELSIFIQYTDSDTSDIKEEFLRMMKIVVNKGTEALFKTMSETFIQKGIPLSSMWFNGMDGTNVMSGKMSVRQQ